MKRAPIVIGATVAGLAGVLAFHTTPSKLNLPALPAAGQTQAASSSGPGGSSGTPRKTSKGRGRTSGTAGSGGGDRTSTGPGVNYDYGILSVKVTVSGNKIINVGIASIDDGGNPRSQSIDQQAIPVLEQEVIQAQNANIQGVSGASYTSQGFTQSLQAALQNLGFQ